MHKTLSIAAIVSLTLFHGGDALAQAAAPVVNTAMGFFVTSVGMKDGGNFGGLAGADAQCQTLAAAVGAGGRTWVAYLSTQETPGNPAINAKDRVGPGPWYNQKGVLIATNPATLNAPGNVNRATALTEKGDEINGRAGPAPLQHDIITGTQKDGTAYPPGTDRTCSNWTSNVAGAPGGAMMGHTDLQGAPADNYWTTAHASNGCSQANLAAGGGNSYLYCFAKN